MTTLRIDGTEGEGGGQLVRTALSLAVATGRPIEIDGIRGKRKNPGLQRQHLACVKAAATISDAQLDGAELGSTRLRFAPRGLRSGNFDFAVGSAGSTSLVLQTVLPALLSAPAVSTLIVRGGTHNPMAPPYEFLASAYLPALRLCGARADAHLMRHGLAPAGGGVLAATVWPASQWRPLELLERRNPQPWRAQALLSRLPQEIGERELDALLDRFGRRGLAFQNTSIQRIDADSPGNVLMIEMPHEDLCEVVTAFGERGVPAETIADRAGSEALLLEAADVPVGPHLCDQLLLPMALGAGGALRTVAPTLHATTNARLIERFLPVRFSFEDAQDGRQGCIVRCNKG